MEEGRELLKNVQKENAALKRQLEQQRLYYQSQFEIIGLVIRKTNESFAEKPGHERLGDGGD